MGVIGTILASVQYIPQIYTTWRLKTVASLSIPMMCIQTPGSFVWAASLAARFGWDGWSSWGLFVVTGILQGVLLTMAILLEIKIRRERFQEEDIPSTFAGVIVGESREGDSGVEDDERTPLIR